MVTAKHALLYRHKVPDGRATVFYIDIRAAGKGYEEFVARVMEEEHVLYARGRVSRVVQHGGKLRVYGVDTLSGQALQVEADLVVLATAIVPPATTELARKLRADGEVLDLQLAARGAAPRDFAHAAVAERDSLNLKIPEDPPYFSIVIQGHQEFAFYPPRCLGQILKILWLEIEPVNFHTINWGRKTCGFDRSVSRLLKKPPFPFESLRANGAELETLERFLFLLSLPKHPEPFPATCYITSS